MSASAAGPRALCCVVLAVVLLPAGARAQKPAGGFVEHDAVDVRAPEDVVIRRVSIDNRLGDVSVEGHDSQSITVRVVKRAGDPETLERLVVSLIPDFEGAAEITTELRPGTENRPVAAGSIAVDLVVLVPRTARVSAVVWNGGLQVTKLDQGAELFANEGDIVVRQVSGPVNAENLRGRQRFAEIFGDLAAQVIEGDLDFDVISGDALHASAVRGQVVGRRVRVRDLKVRTVHGDVKLEAELAAGGRYRVSSRNGSIEFRYRDGPKVLLTASSRDKPRLGEEWQAKRDGLGRWVGSHGQGLEPAHLELRADTKTILVRHF